MMAFTAYFHETLVIITNKIAIGKTFKCASPTSFWQEDVKGKYENNHSILSMSPVCRDRQSAEF